VLASIPPERKAEVADLLRMHGLDAPMGGLRRNALACVALPTCGLALAESERYMPALLSRLEEEAERAGLAQDDITIRVTGCPNGCARPYLAEIGLVGRAPGVYNLYLGGACNGTRLNKLYRKDAGHDAIVASLAPLLREYAKQRGENERFGDYVIRAGHVRATTAGNQFHSDVHLDTGS
jgi:sulfite reductase (NADPH) hemoprotein beta-component